MTEEEIRAKKEHIRQSAAFQNSSSPLKEFQFEQFVENGTAIEGKKAVRLPSGGKKIAAILTFENGLLHSSGGLPAAEWKGHLEWWKNGLIERVVDYERGSEEIWKDGAPAETRGIEQ